MDYGQGRLYVLKVASDEFFYCFRNQSTTVRTHIVKGYGTDGINREPLNRRRTLLSIPFGFRHAALTVLNRSE